MGNCYSIDHIAEYDIHTDITCNTEEPQQKYRLGTVSNRLLGDLDMINRIRILALSFCNCQIQIDSIMGSCNSCY